ncbi:DUF1365 domain-containing protein [Spirillospora sp. NPDC047279]|uniref:DUF1365 domain-containing protein n=1 Tax=Spirillospora sp. NPDC047279 TaxID=3155478 RepID=UPI0033E7B643
MVSTAARQAPALYECTLVHVRPGPSVRNTFRYRTYMWLVDLDALPRPPRPLRALARFRAADHAGSPDRTLRENLEEFLAANDVVADGRVLMLAHARVLGHVFNPLTVYWCFTAAGDLACVVAEVHNTYGGRHRYLLHTDGRGRAETAKEFYVSPFYPVAGTYRMRLPVPGPDLLLTITLHGAAPGRPFVASLQGVRRPATTAGLLRAFLRHPWAPLAGAARIRVQGVKLYLRGLRPQPRHDATVRGEART